MKKLVLSAICLFGLAPLTTAIAEDSAGKAVVNGVGDFASGAAKVTGDAVGAVVDGGGKVLTGTAGLVKEGAQGVTNAVTTDPVSADAKAKLDAKVNCANAPADIATLEKEKASTVGRVGQGVKSVLPVTAAVRLLSGTYQDGVEVAAGTYNDDLNRKISQIKTTCHL